MPVARTLMALLFFAFCFCDLYADDGVVIPATSIEAFSEGNSQQTSAVISSPVDTHEATETFDFDHDIDEQSFWEVRRGMADKHAPAGIMGDHIHEQGEIMVEYKYMNMYMDDNRIGTTTVSDAAALNALGTNGVATPTQMTMEMHMLHLMYGWSDDITLYTMLMYHSNTMDHLRDTPFTGLNPGLAGVPFTTNYDAFGDTAFGALVRLYHTECEDLILNLGCSVPTGSLDQQTNIPNPGAPQEFPYPMRPGTGTFNARPGITYKRYFCDSSFGAQLQTVIPIGENDQSYSVSDEYRLSLWYSQLVHEQLAFSFRVENLWRSNYDGADPDLNPAIISTNRPDMRGGQWVNFGYGAMLLVGDGHLFNLEVIQPIYQDLDGIQLETDWSFAASWSKAF